MLHIGPNGEFIELDEYTSAVADNLKRNGCASFEVHADPKSMFPCFVGIVAVRTEQGIFYEVAAGRTRPEAAFRLLDELATGSTHQSCNLPVVFFDDVEQSWDDFLVFFEMQYPNGGYCGMKYDPATKIFRNSCLGSGPLPEPEKN